MTDHYIDLVTRFADDALDRLGTEHSPLLYDGLDLASNSPLRWEQHALSNLACQQNFLRALDAYEAAGAAATPDAAACRAAVGTAHFRRGELAPALDGFRRAHADFQVRRRLNF